MGLLICDASLLFLVGIATWEKVGIGTLWLQARAFNE